MILAWIGCFLEGYLDSEFPRRGTYWVTHVTMVAREGTRRCIPVHAFGLFTSPQTTKLVMYSAGALF